MARTWFVLLLLALIVQFTVGDDTCRIIENLPQCADSCLSEAAVSGNCSDMSREICTAQYKSVISCYETHCGLKDYLYAMSMTNTLCGIPPRKRQGTQIAVGTTFIVLTTLVVALRIAGRPPCSDSFGIDDAIGLITYCTAMVDTAVMLAGVKVGWGTDMWALNKQDIIQQMKLFYIGIIYFYFSVSISKLAILFFYLRIFTTQTFKKVTYGLIALCSAYAIAVIFQSAFDCSPPSYFWTRFDGVSQGTCLPYAAFKVMPPINIALDVVVMVLPLPLLLRLNLPWAKKLRVISMFSVGILIIIAGTLRMTHLYHSITAYNITYNGGEISYFGVIEADVSVICTCMPAIAALLKRILPRLFGSAPDSGLTYRTFQTVTSPRTTIRGSTLTKPTRPTCESAENIQLITVLSDEETGLEREGGSGFTGIARPEKCLSPL
ncbi:hypothetical protein BDW69DRAFT_181913 [Aspergillus filifer]